MHSTPPSDVKECGEKDEQLEVAFVPDIRRYAEYLSPPIQEH